MKGGIWITNEHGEPEFLHYEDLDVEALPQLWKPVGGFCYEANTFVNLPLPAVPFYVEGWLPKPGKMILYGQAKAGKSYLCLQLARCLGAGEPFLGVDIFTAKVLYVQFELGTSVLQKRMQSTGKNYNNVVVGTSFAMKLDSMAGQQVLERAIREVHPNVVIVDPFYKTLRGDENESGDVAKVLDFFDDMIEAYECSFVIVHHTGKDITRGARGSSVLEDWADGLIEVKRTKEGVKITPKLLRHSALPPQPITARMNELFEFEEADTPLTVKEQVMVYLAENKVAVPQEILDADIGSKGSVYDALRVLVKDGYVHKLKRGEYIWSGGENAQT